MTGVQTAWRLPKCHTSAQALRHHALTTVIGTKDLLDEQHDRRQRTVEAFAPVSSFLIDRRFQHMTADHLAQRSSRRLNKPRTKPPNLFGETPVLGNIHLG